MSDLDKISSLFNAKIDSVKSKEELQNIKTEFFGKNGHITTQFKSLEQSMRRFGSVCIHWVYALSSSSTNGQRRLKACAQ